MGSATIEHYNHLQRRFLAITTPKEMPDNLLFSFIHHQYMIEIGSDDLTPQDRLNILDRYVAWYSTHNKKPPFPEWVEKYRQKWNAS